MAPVCYIDGSCHAGEAWGAAAVMDDVGGASIHTSVSRRGVFVGSASCELVGVIIGIKLVEDYMAQSGYSGDVVLYTDSKQAYDYLHGFTPTSPEGRKLVPLILLARRVAATHANIGIEWRSRVGNRAHTHARNAMRSARNGIEHGDFDLVHVDLNGAIREVECMTRIVHPWVNREAIAVAIDTEHISSDAESTTSLSDSTIANASDSEPVEPTYSPCPCNCVDGDRYWL